MVLLRRISLIRIICWLRRPRRMCMCDIYPEYSNELVQCFEQVHQGGVIRHLDTLAQNIEQVHLQVQCFEQVYQGGVIRHLDVKHLLKTLNKFILRSVDMLDESQTKYNRSDLQYNLNGSNTDGPFTVDDSNSFF